MAVPNVDFLLLAEFDIDKGSLLRVQYPRDTGCDEHAMAELMLPEGSHGREEDWTTFFVRLREDPESCTPCTLKADDAKKTPPKLVVPKVTVLQYNKDVQDWSRWQESGSSESLSFRCIGNRHALVAKDEDGKDVVVITIHPDMQYTKLQNDFVSLYTENDVAVGILFENPSDEPKLGKEVATLSSEEEERRRQILAARSDAAPTEAPDFLYCLSFVRTVKDDTVRRGAVVRSLAVCTRYQFYHIFKPILILALEKYYKEPTIETLAYIYKVVNAVDLTKMPVLTDLQKLVAKLTVSMNTTPYAPIRFHEYATAFEWEVAKIPVRIPLLLEPDECGSTSVVALVQKFKDATMNLFNAIIFGKRVLFLGYQHPAHEICDLVLASSLLVAPLSGVVRDRVYPYVSLVDLSFLQVPGYIAGVTNPMFGEREEWWDVLCDIGTGKVTVRRDKASSGDPESEAREKEERKRYTSMDAEFIERVQAGIEAHLGERWVRDEFRDYTSRIVEGLFFDSETLSPDDKDRQKEMEANRPRTEKWKQTLSFKRFEKHRAEQLRKRTIKNVDIGDHIRKLRVKKDLGEEELVFMYRDFLAYLKTTEQLTEFLSYLPPSQGGLYPVAVSLFHTSPVVRRLTTDLFLLLESLEEGKRIVSSLNYFLLMAYHRNERMIGRKKL